MAMSEELKCPKHTTGGGPCYCDKKEERVSGRPLSCANIYKNGRLKTRKEMDLDALNTRANDKEGK